MHTKPVDAHPLDGRFRVPLAPIPKLFVQARRFFGECQRAGLGQAKIVNVIVRSANACPLSTFSGVVAQFVRDDQKISPIKRHPESRSRTRARHQNDGNCLTTTPYQKTVGLAPGRR